MHGHTRSGLSQPPAAPWAEGACAGFSRLPTPRPAAPAASAREASARDCSSAPGGCRRRRARGRRRASRFPRSGVRGREGAGIPRFLMAAGHGPAPRPRRRGERRPARPRRRPARRAAEERARAVAARAAERASGGTGAGGAGRCGSLPQHPAGASSSRFVRPLLEQAHLQRPVLKLGFYSNASESFPLGDRSSEA